MPQIDLVDDTFVVAPPTTVAALVADPACWQRWWPDLVLSTTRDRGSKGRQWRVDGALRGTSEIWLEPWRDGVLVHYYLRADVAGRRAGSGAGSGARAERHRRAQQWKRAVHHLKDTVERGRRPGEPGPGQPGRTETDLKQTLSAADGAADE